MGGRVAEDLVFNHRSTGASNDLQVSTERARRMVTEFGMSDAVGPRAWGTSGPVFLGDDFGTQREYSEDTSKLIDAEVERILREAEDHCVELLTTQRKALDLVARALLEHETISGAEVTRLISVASGTLPADPAAPAPTAAPTATGTPGTTPPPLPSTITPPPAAPPSAGPLPEPPQS
jgi:cell division protease FtsH